MPEQNKMVKSINGCDGCPAALLCMTGGLYCRIHCSACDGKFVKTIAPAHKTIPVGDRKCPLKNPWKDYDTAMKMAMSLAFGTCDKCRFTESLKRTMGAMSRNYNSRGITDPVARQDYIDDVDLLGGTIDNYFGNYAVNDAKNTSAFWSRMKGWFRRKKK